MGAGNRFIFHGDFVTSRICWGIMKLVDSNNSQSNRFGHWIWFRIKNGVPFSSRPTTEYGSCCYSRLVECYPPLFFIHTWRKHCVEKTSHSRSFARFTYYDDCSDELASIATVNGRWIQLNELDFQWLQVGLFVTFQASNKLTEPKMINYFWLMV